VGFNAMQPGKVKRADVIMLICAVAVMAALIYWAVH
jgi:hypothetical protein